MFLLLRISEERTEVTEQVGMAGGTGQCVKRGMPADHRRDTPGWHANPASLSQPIDEGEHAPLRVATATRVGAEVTLPSPSKAPSTTILSPAQRCRPALSGLLAVGQMAHVLGLRSHGAAASVGKGVPTPGR